VQGSNQRRKLVLRNILQFIDEQDKRCIRFPRRGTHYFEQSLEIVFQVTIVREPALWFVVDPDFDVVILYFQGAGKTSKTA